MSDYAFLGIAAFLLGDGLSPDPQCDAEHDGAE